MQGHIRPILCQNHSSTFVYGPILMKIFMNAIELYMTWNITLMLWRSIVVCFTLRHSDLITTLTYILIDKFCPCLIRALPNNESEILRKSIHIIWIIIFCDFISMNDRLDIRIYPRTLGSVNKGRYIERG